jgi:hypothetical protein
MIENTGVKTVDYIALSTSPALTSAMDSTPPAMISHDKSPVLAGDE